MARFMKWSLGLLAVLVLLVVAGIVAITVFIDPNKFKPDIIKAAKEKGVALKLDGELAWQFFPDLGIVLQQVAVAAVTTPETPVAAIKQAALSVQVMPLFSGNVAVNGILVDGLDAKLAVDAEGKGNWETLMQPAAGQGQAADEQNSQAMSIAVHRLVITNSQISYQDAKTQQTSTLSNFAFEGADITLDNQPFLMKTSGDFALVDSLNPPKNGHFEVSAGIALNEAVSTVAVTNGNIVFTLASAEAEQSFNGKMEVTADLPGENQAMAVKKFELIDAEIVSKDLLTKQNVTLTGFGIAVQDITFDRKPFLFKMQGTVKAELPGMPVLSSHFDMASTMSVDQAMNEVEMTKASLLANINGDDKQRLDMQWNIKATLKPLAYNGDIHLAPVNARLALPAIGQALPVMQSSTALGRVGFSGQLSGSENMVAANDFVFTLDSSTFKGSIAVTDIAKKALVLKLQGDQVNADDYLPPVPETPATETAVAETDEVLIPLDTLRGLNMDVDFGVEKLTLKKLPFSHFKTSVSAHDGVVNISRFTGNLYDSPMQLKTRIDASGETAVIDFDFSSKQLPVGQLMKDMQMEEHFSGSSDVSAVGKTRGVRKSELMQALDATVDMSGQKMQLAEINIEKTLCEMVAKVEHKTLAVQNWNAFTQFRDMTTHIVVKNGVANVQSFQAGVEKIAMKTNGQLQFIEGKFDFHLTARLTDAVTAGSGCEVTNKSLLNRDIPIRCKGSFADMGVKTCLPDMSFIEDLAKDALKEKVKQETDAAKTKANEKVDKLLQEKLGVDKDKAKDLIKGLFKK